MNFLYLNPAAPKRYKNDRQEPPLAAELPLSVDLFTNRLRSADAKSPFETVPLLIMSVMSRSSNLVARARSTVRDLR
jgi:hypothetical protein